MRSHCFVLPNVNGQQKRAQRKQRNQSDHGEYPWLASCLGGLEGNRVYKWSTHLSSSYSPSPIPIGPQPISHSTHPPPVPAFVYHDQHALFIHPRHCCPRLPLYRPRPVPCPPPSRIAQYVPLPPLPTSHILIHLTLQRALRYA